MFKRILVAHDGSDGAQRAFDVSVELASTTEASLHMISVEEDLPRHAEMIVDEVAEVKNKDVFVLRKLEVCTKDGELDGQVCSASDQPWYAPPQTKGRDQIAITIPLNGVEEIQLLTWSTDKGVSMPVSC